MANNIFRVVRELDAVKLEWEIEKFLHLPSVKGNCIKSPEFDLNDTSWCIVIYPHGHIKAGDGEISVFLKLVKGSDQYKLSWNVKMIANGGSLVGDLKLISKFDAKRNESWGFYKLATRSKVNDSLLGSSSGTVTICCIIRVLKESSSKWAFQNTVDLAPPALVARTSQTSSMLASKTLVDAVSQTSEDLTSTILETTEGLENLSQNLKRLLLDGYLTDVTFKVRGKEFSAHKSVLGSRSPVFLAMFQHEMVESNTGVVEINDMDPEFFQDFLLYIYSGKYHCVTPKNAVELFKAADKYDLKDLKKECALRMETSLSLEIILDVILTANNYEEKALFDSASEFFIRNAETIYEMDEFDNFLFENCKLAKELTREALKKEI